MRDKMRTRVRETGVDAKRGAYFVGRRASSIPSCVFCLWRFVIDCWLSRDPGDRGAAGQIRYYEYN